MKKWMNYLKDYHGDKGEYKFFNIGNEIALVKAMEDIVTYAKENDILGHWANPVYNQDDANRFLTGYPEDFYNEELLNKCYEDNKWKTLPELPLRTTNMATFPDDLRQAFLTAFEEYENVDDNLVKFKIHVCLPGDIIMTHYDSPGEWRHEIPYEQTHLETRLMVFMDDWQAGQSVQIGDDLIKWKKYDATERNIKHCLHGAANFGFEPRITFLIGWMKKQ